MDAALGPPESMVEREDDLTPMIRQYVACCRRYDDCLVLFHVGDFYKTFGAAAETVARLCELTLITREDSSGEYPAAGIPVEKAETYVETLLDAGYRVAIAEQVEDPEAVDGVADRQVTRVVTPGTLTEDELLDESHVFVAAVARGDGAHAAARDAGTAAPGADDATYGLALLDVSTGDFYATGVTGATALRDEVGRFDPAEVVVGPDVPDGVRDRAFAGDATVTPFNPAAFDPEAAAETVARYVGAPDAHLASEAEVRACGALLAYAEYARGGAAASGDGTEKGEASDGEGSPAAADDRLDYINHLVRYDPREYVLLDSVAVRSLELFERRSVRAAEGGSLMDVLDETASAPGRRELAGWLRRPLLDEDRIAARHDAVEELVGSVRLRERCRDLLREAYDVERLASRISRGRANARDLRSLWATLEVVPELRDLLADAEADLLAELRADLDPMDDVRGLIDNALVDDPPVELTEGGVIAEGYDDDLDDLRATERENKRWIENLEQRERERTGIDNLEVGHTAVHGYYIEVTDANLDAVPDDYTRRQTLKNSERFYTPELKDREDEIVRAEARAHDLEYDLFVAVREQVGAEVERVQSVAGALAALDALVALAEVAAANDYCRPEVGADRFEVEAGRHPVVERTRDSFVPNDTDLDRGAVAVLTGPNMSGKSTYMRQVALLSILAQAGGFVPAASARLPVVDRVFTRVGASDDIAGGRSTFMVEMTELADILEAATEDSLVILDEVGRGTSTADGFAIARAVTEYLHDDVGATTLFATHHHDLTEVAADLPRACNWHFSAEQRGETVAFDHEIADGPATASYGVEVAREAGVPDPVVERAAEYVDADPASRDGEHRPLTAFDDAAANGHGADDSDAPSADTPAREGEDLRERLRDVDLGETTPIEALNLLAELKEDAGR